MKHRFSQFPSNAIRIVLWSMMFFGAAELRFPAVAQRLPPVQGDPAKAESARLLPIESTFATDAGWLLRIQISSTGAVRIEEKANPQAEARVSEGQLTQQQMTDLARLFET